MIVTKTLSTFSLAFALIGGALVLTPSTTAAASKSTKSTHISFDALKRNNIPCSKRGASANNCRVSDQANKHTRGCSAITRCRG